REDWASVVRGWISVMGHGWPGRNRQIGRPPPTMPAHRWSRHARRQEATWSRRLTLSWACIEPDDAAALVSVPITSGPGNALASCRWSIFKRGQHHGNEPSIPAAGRRRGTGRPSAACILAPSLISTGESTATRHALLIR